MTLADKITSLRLILAPFFFTLYLFPGVFFSAGPLAAGALGGVLPVAGLWVLFVVSEITDLVDGKVARRRKEVNDFGKLFDPFADTLVRITYFLCFVLDGILPVAPFLLVIYREFGILFLRVLMMRKGVAMGARRGGKLKAFSYMLAGAIALLASTAVRLNLDPQFFSWLRLAAVVVFVISVVMALASFVDYVMVYRRTE
jgi:CDP-diacylglycerol--glycerol-3-phosphate 3-phosphatidyltransferase